MPEERLRAVVRPPADSFRHTVSSHPGREGIDPAGAQREHRRFCTLLAALGIDLVELPPDEAHPDACFTQDLAVVLGGRALLCRPALPARKSEVEGMADVLTTVGIPIETVAAPATVEGGDVLRVGSRLVVGRSSRTNDAGVDAVQRFAEPMGYDVRTATVPDGVLHLQTAVTAPAPGLVMGLESVLDQPAFEGLDHIAISRADVDACNVLAVGTAVVGSRRHAAHAALERRGISVHVVGLRDFVLADAGPTCLALLLDDA